MILLRCELIGDQWHVYNIYPVVYIIVERLEQWLQSLFSRVEPRTRAPVSFHLFLVNFAYIWQKLSFVIVIFVIITSKLSTVLICRFAFNPIHVLYIYTYDL